MEKHLDGDKTKNMARQNIFEKIFGINKPKEVEKPKQQISTSFGVFDAVGFGGMRSAGYYGNAYSLNFDGEKDAGSMGTPIEYIVDYNSLSVRSRQIYLENDIAQTVLDKYALWVIGKGLKFQAQPISELLNLSDENIESSKQKIEMMFDVWASSRVSSYNGESNLNWIANETFKNMKISGDCLVLIRFDKKTKQPNIQTIDGQFVCGDSNLTNPTKGNKVDNGIEITPKGKVVAYHVQNANGKYQRIKAFEPTTGLRQAFMVYASKYRIGSVRGLPAISTTMETLKKIDRYKEATVGSAEERQKISYQIVHQLNADGTSPFTQQLAQSFNDAEGDVAQYPNYSDGVQTAQNVTASTNKQTINMPVGSELRQLESKNELYFNDFYTTNANIVCSALGIPPNVAFSLYNDSYSASRASIKDWEHTMRIERSKFQFQFYQPIYEFWLHMNVILNNVELTGYWDSFVAGDEIRLSGFRRARFFGANMPHIDPLKEVQAQRAKLGTLGDDIPLTTVDEATETLSGGDAKQNMTKFAKELEIAKSFNLEQNPND